MGLDEYPETDEILKAARKYCPNGHVIDASNLAKKLGNVQMTNVVMLGALVKVLPFFDYKEMRSLVASNSPAKFKKANLKAFEEGYKIVKS
jgi:Pyruvate/2-oxoacid:ferredoxin oxidoreductase gamma subunit